MSTTGPRLRARRRLQLAFDAGHLNERGTDVALYDYAHFAETLLGHRSRILCPKDAELTAIERFRRRFPIWLYGDARDRQAALRDVDVYYRIVHGAREEEPVPRPPAGRSVLHCVFQADAPRGDVYAAVSDWVATHRGPQGGHVPVVPHIVHLPEVAGDLREELGIPRDAVVLGRHGGPTTFDLPFVHAEVANAVAARSDLWFVFLNTPQFAPTHPRILHLPATTDVERKVRFLQSCDGMLHGRSDGETFGLAIGEFSILNKPVIAWSGGTDRYHVEVLGERGLFYADARELRVLLSGFAPMAGDFDAYSARFGPEAVMGEFARVFLGEETSPDARAPLAPVGALRGL